MVVLRFRHCLSEPTETILSVRGPVVVVNTHGKFNFHRKLHFSKTAVNSFVFLPQNLKFIEAEMKSVKIKLRNNSASFSIFSGRNVSSQHTPIDGRG